MPEAAVLSAVLVVALLSTWTVAVGTDLGADLDSDLGSATDSALACAALFPRSIVTSRGPGAKLAAGPSGLGDNTARERSRLRNSSARYCCAAERPLQARATTPRAAKNMCLKTIKAS